jgi:hypothetical protein
MQRPTEKNGGRRVCCESMKLQGHKTAAERSLWQDGCADNIFGSVAELSSLLGASSAPSA